MSRPSALEHSLLEAIAHPERLRDEAAFNALALALFRHQLETNLPYRQFCESKPGGVSPRSWKEIPALPTSAFRFAPLRTFPEAETVATFRTSGTTGEGFGSHHFVSTRFYDASIRAAWKELGLPPLPQVLLIQHPRFAPHSSLSHMMGVLGTQVPQTYTLTETGKLDLTLLRKAVLGESPVLLLGTALAFLHLFEELCDPLPLPIGSLALETGGYKGSGRALTKEELYRQFHEKLGLPAEAIVNEYSMTELSSQWYTRGIGRSHVGPAWTRSLILSPETGHEVAIGEHGVLRLIDLANIGSVIAIQTQDLAVRTPEGFLLLGRDPSAIPRGCSRAADEQLRNNEESL